MHAAIARDLEPWCDLVQAEFGQVKTLRLTARQARRLWSFDQATCEAVLARLVTRRFLMVGEDGRYCRADCLDGAASMD
jgi:hypothetical protein